MLSQRPLQTGSGITLDALVRHAAEAGWEQRVVVGVPAAEPQPEVGGLPSEQVYPLKFGAAGDLDFELPGMSDVMPYPSTRFSAMDPGQLARYREAWRAHLKKLLEHFQPDVVHSHHLWILSSILKDLLPNAPVVTHCHGTGLRQLELCRHLAPQVLAGCRRNDRILVLHDHHLELYAEALGLDAARLQVVGAGFRDELFHARGREPVGPELLYAGKYSRSKGLPWLLDAVQALSDQIPDLRLHVAGSGAGDEADALRDRMAAMPGVVMHGQLDQAGLADLMRRSAVFVLPSFFEGLPLVLVEALACGCRLVCTELPGVTRELAPKLGEVLELVPLPRLDRTDVPLKKDLPKFVLELSQGIQHALSAAESPLDAAILGRMLRPFTWREVFKRVARVWQEVIA